MFSDILKRLRAEKGISQKDFAAQIGVVQSTVGMWESNRRKPDFAMVCLIANYFNVSVDYLLGRERLDQTAKLLFEHIDHPAYGMSPVVGSVRCGWDGTIEQEFTGEYAPVYDMNPEEYVWIIAKGDSMTPKIENGDHVLVHLQSIAENGDIVVVILNGDEGTLKKFKKEKGGVTLSPLNPKYSHMYIPNDSDTLFQIYGKAVKVEKRL